MHILTAVLYITATMFIYQQTKARRQFHTGFFLKRERGNFPVSILHTYFYIKCAHVAQKSERA